MLSWETHFKRTEMMPSEYMLKSYYLDLSEPTEEVTDASTIEEDED